MSATSPNNLSILVNSCDAYSDCWYPFFACLKRFGMGIEKCPIFLNTETKRSLFNGLSITTCNTAKGCDWGERLINAVRNIKSDYILFMLDDFFIRDNVDIDLILRYLHLMNSDRSVGCIYLVNHPYSLHDSKFDGLEMVPRGVKYRISAQAAIWRKDILLMSILRIENPWQWEIYGSERNNTILKRISFYSVPRDSNPPINYGLKQWEPWGIVQGKWYKDDIVPFFKSIGIDMNFDERGYYFKPSCKINKDSAHVKKVRPRHIKMLRGGGIYKALRCCKYGIIKLLDTVMCFFSKKASKKERLCFVILPILCSFLIKDWKDIDYKDWLKING